MKKGFDSARYVKFQTEEIKNRIKKFDRLYLEFGGKLCYDLHASRVLPGYEPTNKLKILKKLGKIEMIYCVNAEDIQRNRVLGDFHLSCAQQTLNDIKTLKKFGLRVNYIVITRNTNQPEAKKFYELLKKKGFDVIFHSDYPKYLNGPSYAIESYKIQPHIKTKSKLIIITGAASGSGKMATGLNQIYHDSKMGLHSAYAKFETFPIWNLPLENPINIAYEAATADLGDINMIDSLHKKFYGLTAVNYNRDIENFEILRRLVKEMNGEKFPFGYKSPTDMGINMAKSGITNLKICEDAATNEIKRRYGIYLGNYLNKKTPKQTLVRMNELLSKLNLPKMKLPD